MSQFTATKCDECGRVQGAANHWERMAVWYRSESAVVQLGNFNATIPAEAEVRDLCGQGCALKHLAKLLGWSQPADAAQEERA